MTAFDDRDDEIERRLRADAARHDADDPGVPPLTDVLATATARRRPQTWLAVAASVLLVAGLAAGLGLHGIGGGHPPAGSFGTAAPPPPPSGVPTARDGDRLFYFSDAGFNGVVLDPADPRVLGIVIPYDKSPDACSLYGAAAHIVSQDSSTVTLKVSGFQYLKSTAAHQKYTGFSCYGGGVAVVRVQLNAPLGNRRIQPYRAPSGALGPGPVFTIPADPTDLPSPTYLPAGYELHSSRPASFRTGRLLGERYYSGADAKLVLQVGPPSEVQSLNKNRIGHGRVGGVASVITAEPHVRCITWSETSGRMRQVCSYADPTLGNAELLRIARSIR